VIPLSVVVPVREGLAEVADLLETMLPGAGAVGAEVVVVGDLGPDERAPDERVLLVRVRSRDILELHRRGVEAARGEVVAMGEDHAVPRPDWWQGVIRAHAENPQVPAIAGCLVNATDATVSGRANFLAFAAPWQPPMPTLPLRRPPPCSALSFKRWALEPATEKPAGWLEAELIPAAFGAGEMLADERIVVDHHQDHGLLWAIRNAFHSARSSYGYERERLPPRQRWRVARWALANVPPRQREEAREGAFGRALPWGERSLIAVLGYAHMVGAVVGVLVGKGSSPDRLA
jgi:hypothetical protein